MSQSVQPPFDLLLATADDVAAQRPDVDLELAREVFREADPWQLSATPRDCTTRRA